MSRRLWASLLLVAVIAVPAHAQLVVAACERAAAEGRGAASLDGKMIDAANIRMARFVLEKHRLIPEKLS